METMNFTDRGKNPEEKGKWMTGKGRWVIGVIMTLFLGMGSLNVQAATIPITCNGNATTIVTKNCVAPSPSISGTTNISVDVENEDIFVIKITYTAKQGGTIVIGMNDANVLNGGITAGYGNYGTNLFKYNKYGTTTTSTLEFTGANSPGDVYVFCKYDGTNLNIRPTAFPYLSLASCPTDLSVKEGLVGSSVVRPFTLTGCELTTAVTISLTGTNAGCFELSANGTNGWGSSISISAPTSLNNANYYVRMKENGSCSANATPYSCQLQAVIGTTAPTMYTAICTISGIVSPPSYIETDENSLPFSNCETPGSKSFSKTIKVTGHDLVAPIYVSSLTGGFEYSMNGGGAWSTSTSGSPSLAANVVEAPLLVRFISNSAEPSGKLTLTDGVVNKDINLIGEIIEATLEDSDPSVTFTKICSGGTFAAEKFSVKGLCLSGSVITVEPESGFAISQDGTLFVTTSLTTAIIDGVADDEDFWVKPLSSAATITDQLAVTLSGGGADPYEIYASGTVTAPKITLSETSIAANRLKYCSDDDEDLDGTSPVKITVTRNDCESGDLSISVSNADFEISVDGTNFYVSTVSTPLTLLAAEEDFWVRLAKGKTGATATFGPATITVKNSVTDATASVTVNGQVVLCEGDDFYIGMIATSNTWSNPAHWFPSNALTGTPRGTLPGERDKVIIVRAAGTLTLGNNTAGDPTIAKVASVTIDNGAAGVAANFQINASSSLEVIGDVNFVITQGQFITTLNGTLTVDNMTVTNAGLSNASSFALNNNLTVKGNLTIGSTGVLNVTTNSTTATLKVNGSLTLRGNAQAVFTVPVLELTGCGQTITLTRPVTVTTFRQSSTCNTRYTLAFGTPAASAFSRVIINTAYDQNCNPVILAGNGSAQGSVVTNETSTAFIQNFCTYSTDVAVTPAPLPTQTVIDASAKTIYDSYRIKIPTLTSITIAGHEGGICNGASNLTATPNVAVSSWLWQVQSGSSFVSAPGTNNQATYNATVPGAYRVIGTTTTPNCSIPSGAVPLAVIPETILTWTGSANNSNWYDKGNWEEDGNSAKFAPRPCDDVTITNAATLPILGTPAECNDIIFEPNAAVGGIDKLRYHEAKAQMIIQATATMAFQNRWYMLAQTIGGVTASNYKSSGSSVFLREFETNSQTASWSTAIQNFSGDLTAGDGFVYKASNIAGNSVTLTFGPDRFITDNEGETELYLNVKKSGSGDIFDPLTGLSDAENHGFAITGNSFMSHLKVELLLENPAIASSGVKVYVSSPLGGDFENMTTGYIAPFQAFIVMPASGGVTGLTLTSAMLDAVSTSTLRGLSSSDNTLRIRASQGGYTSVDALVTAKDGATNAFDINEDAPKLFSAESPLAVTTLAGDKACDLNTLDRNSLNGLMVPINIRSTKAGAITLEIDGAIGFLAADNIYLYDNESGISTSLLETSTFIINKDNAGDINGRFFLQFFKEEIGEPTNINELALSSLYIGARQNNIVIQSRDEEILSVTVFDITGRKVFNADNIKTTVYSRSLPAGSAYMVKVVTNKQVKTGKVIIK
jgi:hypothetical protein